MPLLGLWSIAACCALVQPRGKQIIWPQIIELPSSLNARLSNAITMKIWAICFVMHTVRFCVPIQFEMQHLTDLIFNQLCRYVIVAKPCDNEVKTLKAGLVHNGPPVRCRRRCIALSFVWKDTKKQLTFLSPVAQHSLCTLPAVMGCLIFNDTL